MVPAGEPGHVADIADDGGSDHRADAEDASQAGPGAPDSRIDLLAGLADLGIDAAQAGGVLGGELPACGGNGPGRGDRFQDPPGLACGDLFRDPAGDQLRSTACSRQATWVRERPRSLYRLDQILSTAG